MIPRFPRFSAVLPPLLVGLAVYGGAAASRTGPGPAEAGFLRLNDAAMNRMMAAMQVRPTGDVDRDFAGMMIPHHQGGIDMAKALLRYGKDERMKALARAIITKQQEEIVLMRRLSGLPAHPAPGHAMSMPGTVAKP